LFVMQHSGSWAIQSLTAYADSDEDEIKGSSTNDESDQTFLKEKVKPQHDEEQEPRSYGQSTQSVSLKFYDSDGDSSNMVEPTPPHRRTGFSGSSSQASASPPSKASHRESSTGMLVNYDFEEDENFETEQTGLTEIFCRDEEYTLTIQASESPDDIPPMALAENLSDENIESVQGEEKEEEEMEEGEQPFGDLDDLAAVEKAYSWKIDDMLPPLTQKKCPSALKETFEELFRQKEEENFDFNSTVQKRTDFRNPSIYEKLVDHFGLDEKGSNFPLEFFDPHGFNKKDFYDQISAAQKLLMDNLEKEKKTPDSSNATTTSSNKGENKLIPERRRQSKWDRPDTSSTDEKQAAITKSRVMSLKSLNWPLATSNVRHQESIKALYSVGSHARIDLWNFDHQPTIFSSDHDAVRIAQLHEEQQTETEVTFFQNTSLVKQIYGWLKEEASGCCLKYMFPFATDHSNSLSSLKVNSDNARARSMSQPPQVLALDAEQLRLQTAGKEPNKNQLSPCSPSVLVTVGPIELYHSPAEPASSKLAQSPANESDSRWRRIFSKILRKKSHWMVMTTRTTITMNPNHQHHKQQQQQNTLLDMEAKYQASATVSEWICTDHRRNLSYAMFEKAKVVERFAKGPANTGVMRRHEQLLTDLIGQAVEKINEPSEPFLQTCYNYGAAHANISVGFMEDCIWEQLAEAVLDRINMVGLVRKHRDLSKAWTLLVTVIVEKIKDGYLQRHKQHSREAAKRETVRRESSF
ncbi:SAP30-binding protein, partial [Trichinella sp. T9]